MKRSAFTMLELVFVIVVVGILGAVLLPRMERDSLYEATEQMLSHIRYAQHLALMDNVYDDGNAVWFQNRWSVVISGNGYAVQKNGLNALDPVTRVPINGSGDYDLDSKYSAQITSGNYTLLFDHLGRPYGNGIGATPTANLLKNDLNITVSANGETATIRIQPESGYSYVCWPGNPCP